MRQYVPSGPSWNRTGADTSLTLRRKETHENKGRELIPEKGERIELLRPRMGIRVRGTVFYSDQLQILVKWDDGRSESLRPGVDGYRKVDSGQPGATLPTST